MASLFSAASASLVAHHLPLASTLQGIFSSTAGVFQWPSLATQQVHSITCWVNDQACYMCCQNPACNPYTCCMAGGLLPTCLMVFCHPMVADFDDDDHEATSLSAKNEPKASLRIEDLPSLIDQDDMFVEEDV